ncbi:MAG: glycosyltransferase, partial [Steroidobacteraceae bacterium]|nr:glycosyltransferase [Deltaproteobacteria bacterium]
MKIVFLAPFGIRPKGTVLARMIPIAVGLKQLEHEVVIIAPPYTNPEDSGREDFVQGIRLSNIRLDTTLGATPLVLAWRMFRLAMAEQPDLVHLFKPKGYGGLAAMLLILLRGIGFRLPPLMVDSDDWEGRGGMNDILPYSRAERWVFAFQEQWLLSRALAVSVASRGLEQMVRELGVVPESCCYLPNGVGQLSFADGGLIRRR